VSSKRRSEIELVRCVECREWMVKGDPPYERRCSKCVVRERREVQDAVDREEREELRRRNRS